MEVIMVFKLRRVAAALSGLGIVTACALPASASPAGYDHAAVKTTPAGHAIAAYSCPSGDFCVWSGTNYTGRELELSHDDSDWGSFRNVDESLVDNADAWIRIWYSPNYGDPHTCVGPFTDVPNLSPYYFNSGGPHYPVENDIASSTMSDVICQAPMINE
jgi:hypothetical protein